MKPVQIYTGLQIVLSDSPNATIYTVCEIEGHSVNLTYSLLNGKTADGGWVDVSLLRLPDIYQMSNN